MPRNSGGTYTLPNGNPVTSGTTISSTVHNNTNNDLASEVTNSLDRAGRGAMLAPLEVPNGTAALPSLTFDNDTDTGFYLVGANDLGVTVGGAQAAHITASAVTMTLPFVGSGAGAGVVSTGGSTSGNGGTFTGGAANGNGLVSTGDGTGAGINATGGDNGGFGGVFTGGATNGTALMATGSGTGGGATFANGTAATTSTARTAVTLTNGYLAFSGVANPDNDVAFTNTVTPKNLIKAWARLQTNGAGTISVLDGFNVSDTATISGAGNTLFNVTILDDLADVNYGVLATLNGAATGRSIHVESNGAGAIRGEVWDQSVGAALNLSATILNFTVMVMGAQ